MKKVIKIIVAIWAIAITFWEVFDFATTLPIEFGRFPFISVLLMVVGILLLVPSMDKHENILMVIALIIFGFLAISALIAFIKGIGAAENIVSYIWGRVSKVIFILIPALLSFVFLFGKETKKD